MIFITGATGMIGRWVMKDAPKDVVLLKGKMEDFQFPREKVSHILHMATPKNADIVTVVKGALRIRELAERDGAKVLFTSSGAVNGQDTEYAKGKRAAEDILRPVAIIARIYSVIGPEMHPHFAISQFIEGAKRGKITVTRSRAIRSYLHAQDVREWIWELLLNGPIGETVDVGGNYPLRLGIIAGIVNNIVNSSAQLDVTETDGTYYVPSLHRATALGLKQTISLGEAIKITAEGKW